MNKRFIFYLLITVVFASVSYVSTENIIVTSVVGGITILYFLILAEPKIKKALYMNDKYHQCYQFINSFIISINVRKSLTFAFDNVRAQMSDEYISLMEGITDLNENEKLTYLNKFFPFHVYSLFLNVINLWQEQGGDILSMSKYLLNESRDVEEYIINSERISKRKIIEFSSLWFFAIAILVVIRFALSQFFSHLSTLLFYPISISVFFLFILISIHIIITRAFTYDIKGWKE